MAIWRRGASLIRQRNDDCDRRTLSTSRFRRWDLTEAGSARELRRVEHGHHRVLLNQHAVAVAEAVERRAGIEIQAALRIHRHADARIARRVDGSAERDQCAPETIVSPVARLLTVLIAVSLSARKARLPGK